MRYLALIPLLFLFSCKKNQFTEPCEVQDIVHNDSIPTTPYLQLTEGSWWQYTNGMIDTCRYELYYSTASNETDCDGVLVKHYRYYPKSRVLGFMDGNQKIWNGTDPEAPTYRSPFYADQSGPIGCIEYKSGSGTTVGINNRCVMSFGWHDSIVLNGITYFDVYESRSVIERNHPHAPSPLPDQTLHVYFARDIGVVAYHSDWMGVGSAIDTAFLVDYDIAP